MGWERIDGCFVLSYQKKDSFRQQRLDPLVAAVNAKPQRDGRMQLRFGRA